MARRSLSISLQGKPELLAAFKRASESVNSGEMQDAILPAAQVVRDIAKRLASLGAGKRPNGQERTHLRDLIFATKGKRTNPGGLTASIAAAIEGDSGPSVIAGVDLKKAPHAHLVEFGHGGPHPAPAHPFMRPAVTAARPMVIRVMENAVRKVLSRI